MSQLPLSYLIIVHCSQHCVSSGRVRGQPAGLWLRLLAKLWFMVTTYNLQL